ncbi:3'-5' exoribonuclease YhaM [compost metagenome]
MNRDLLLFGGIFHDIGKIWELSYDSHIAYTDRGRLLGHMEMACELIDKKAARILGFSDELRDICKHIILSHHGKLEYGSPKRPKFLEALVVAMVDDFDSKVSTVHSLITEERGSGEKWSRYSDLFDRYFLLDDLNEKF